MLLSGANARAQPGTLASASAGVGSSNHLALVLFNAMTAADIVLYPNVAYCKRITFRKPEAKLVEIIPPKLAAWAARIEALPFFEKTFPPHWR